MKKLECHICKGVWFIKDLDLEKQRVCPYCSVAVQEQIGFENYDSLSKLIYAAISKMGIDIMQNPRSLFGFMMDTAPTMKKEIKIFSKTVTNGYLIHVKKAFEQDIGSAELIIQKLKHMFIEEEGLSDEWANMICEGLQGAILYYKGIGCTKPVNVNIEDSQTAVQEKEHTEFGSKKGIETIGANGSFQAEKVTTARGAEGKIHQSDNSQPSLVSNPEEVCEFALKYYLGSSFYPKDERKAIKLFREAANYYRYIPAYNHLGRIFMKKRDTENSLKWYKKSADAGDVEGYCMMGYFYSTGYGVKQKSSDKALKYYLKAASTGELDRMVSIARRFLTGGDVPKTERVGVGILDAAKNAGNPDAKYYLAQCYQNGIGVQKDLEKAIDLYKAAGDSQTEAKAELKKLKDTVSFSEKLKYGLRG